MAAKPMQPGEIIALAMAMDQGEVDLSTSTRDKLTNPQVKSFAAMLIKHHQKSLDTYRKMSERQNMTPQPNEMVQTLQQKVQQNRDALANLSGAELDRQFVLTNVQMHQDSQRHLREHLIPAAQDPKLKAQLEKQEKLVTQHLAQAERLQKQLQGAPQS